MPSLWARPESEQQDKAPPQNNMEQNQENLKDRDEYTKKSDEDDVSKEVDSSRGSESDSDDSVELKTNGEAEKRRSQLCRTLESLNAIPFVFGILTFVVFAPILLLFPFMMFAIMAPILFLFPVLCFVVIGLLPMILFCITPILFFGVVVYVLALLSRNILWVPLLFHQMRIIHHLGKVASRIPRFLLFSIESLKARITALMKHAKFAIGLAFIRAVATARSFFRPRGMIYRPPGTLPWNKLPASHFPEPRVGLQNSWSTTDASQHSISRTQIRGRLNKCPPYQNAGLRKYFDHRLYKRIGLGVGLELGYAGLLRNKSDKESGNKDT